MICAYKKNVRKFESSGREATNGLPLSNQIETIVLTETGIQRTKERVYYCVTRLRQSLTLLLIV